LSKTSLATFATGIMGLSSLTVFEEDEKMEKK